MDRNKEFLWSILVLNIIVLPIWILKISNKKVSFSKRRFSSLYFLKFLFIEYIICLVSVTIIPLPYSKVGVPCLNLDPLHQTYNNFVSALNHTSDRTVWSETENLLGNIFLFFPLGLVLPILYNNFNTFIKVFIIGLGCSFFIEATQYFISVNWGYNRISDIDDLIFNTLGTAIGFLFFKISTIFNIRLKSTIVIDIK